MTNGRATKLKLLHDRTLRMKPAATPNAPYGKRRARFVFVVCAVGFGVAYLVLRRHFGITQFQAIAGLLAAAVILALLARIAGAVGGSRRDAAARERDDS